MHLKDRVALITGGTSGIGEGARVCITGRNPERGAGVVAHIKASGGDAFFMKADVSLAEDCRQAVDETLRIYGSLDILFNNAGVFYPQTAIECSEKEWDEQIDINLKGTFLMSKLALPTMIAQGRGVIINNSSGWAWSAAIARWLTAHRRVELC
jgi:NAD(P)-dependent dehydrogenase (short-subunit alcohol dehydrogenase family)